MQRSLRSRVLALAGLAVLGAAAALALAARQTLDTIESTIAETRTRVADTIAAGVARDVLADLEILQGVRAAPGVNLPARDVDAEARALAIAARSLRVADAVCVASADAQVLRCEPNDDAVRLAPPMARRAIAGAILSGRPLVTGFFDAGPWREALAIVPISQIDREAEGAVVAIVEPEGGRLRAALPVPAGLTVGLFDTSGTPAFSSGPTGGSTEALVAGTPWFVRTADTALGGTDPVSELRRRELWVAPLLTAVAMLLAWGVAVSVTRPVAALTLAAERIAAGDLSQPIASGGGDEIGRLGAALEDMRVRLKQSLDSVQRRLLRRVITAQEEERRRVARELHDETSQLVAALGIGLQTAAATTTAAPTRKMLTDLSTVVDRMHEGLHRIIVNLRPSVLDDLGLDAAIHWLADRQLRDGEISARCELHELQDHRLAPEVETAVFRAVQEALANVARHADATSVLIQGGIDEGRLWIDIEDDGRGFDVEAAHPSGDSLRGIGMLGMRERIELAGGMLRVESAPGRGTRVRFDVPIGSVTVAGAQA